MRAEEARALWAAAVRDAPRFRMPFDDAWFEQIAAERARARAGRRRADRRCTARAAHDTPHDTQECTARVLGRSAGRRRLPEPRVRACALRQWVLDEGSRVVAVLGLGGIGKSLLATRLAHDLAPSFERVFWRSLRDAPTPGEWLAEALGFLAPDDAARVGRRVRVAPTPAGAPRARSRCLLVLDNLETVLQPGGPVGGYRAGYERYGTLLRQVAESPHRSCLVITSREEPAELGPLLGERGPVRALDAGRPRDRGRARPARRQAARR